MGCDIHLYVERKENGRWVSLDKWTVDADEFGREGAGVMWEDRFYRHRNYLLFGILAGVRDRSLASISKPRGLPKDVTLEVQKESESWNTDGHSHSWLTLAELQSYDWSSALAEPVGAPSTFVNEAIPKLEALGEPESVRIVFFFDN